MVVTNWAYSIRLNLIDHKTKKLIVSDQPYPSSGLIDENKIGPALQGLTDSVIFEIIYGRNPTAKEISQLKGVLKDKEIPSSIHYPIPDHQQISMKNSFRISGNLDKTEMFSQEIISIPIYPTISKMDLLKIKQALKQITICA